MKTARYQLHVSEVLFRINIHQDRSQPNIRKPKMYKITIHRLSGNKCGSQTIPRETNQLYEGIKGITEILNFYKNTPTYKEMHLFDSF